MLRKGAGAVRPHLGGNMKTRLLAALCALAGPVQLAHAEDPDCGEVQDDPGCDEEGADCVEEFLYCMMPEPTA